ncbi:MAG: multiple sugar transport system substrate-binding protein [Cryptosporangiaceae bacterium]|nr:multiple sugar transport system substrate-binding protein [Cryptosporangiaceae bacterium]
MNRPIRPAAALAAVLALAAASACTAGTPGGGAAAKGGVDKPTTIEFWHFFAGREAAVIASVVKDFEKKNPKITVVIKAGQDDEKMKKAISAGQAVDVGLSYSTDIVGTFCSKKAWRDLASYLKRDKVDLDQFPPVVRSYTAYKGVQCSMPMLADVYGLFYNTDLLAKAGYSAPPKTMTELADMSKKLTKVDARGAITQAGYVPLMPFYENVASHLGPSFGAKWFDGSGKSLIGSDPGWADMLTWHKQQIDVLGADKWKKFKDTAGDEFSAENAFEAGKVALHVDGEYRTAFLKNEVPNLKYATAPLPVADDKPDLYGSGYVTGNIMGIGRGSKSPEAAWQLIKYLSTDTDAILKLSDGLRNIPTTKAALAKSSLKDDPNFTPFLDVFQNPKSTSIPATPNGPAPQQTFQTFIDQVLAGKVPDLKQGLKDVDTRIQKDLQLAGG